MARKANPYVARFAVPRALLGLFAAFAVIPSSSASAEAPLQYLRSFGPRNPALLTWAVLVISLAVTVIVTALLVLALWRSWQPAAQPPLSLAVERPQGGLTALYAGVAISAVVLFGVTVWTIATLAQISEPPAKPLFTIEVTGHQWWWEITYLGEDPSRTFSTANEIHIPVGVPVGVRLKASDVIHSFWVPRLSGKTDLIPGQVNITWLQADREGTYRGQCGEYCGLQHAQMGLQVIATPRAAFNSWWDQQLKGATPVGSAGAEQGERVFLQKCAACHTIRGTSAGGIVGPDLTHLMSRRTIAAASLPNTPGFLSGWIADPQGTKPGSKMPDLDLSGPQLSQVRDFLATLK